MYNVLKTLDYTPQSPDLNQIEHIWKELDPLSRVPDIEAKIIDKCSLKVASEKT